MYDVYCDRPSKSARLLANALGGRRIRDRGQIVPGRTVINWGTTAPLGYLAQSVINRPTCVGLISNKRYFLQTIATQDYCPFFTTHVNVAEDWISDRDVVVCRTLLNASGGRGIVIAADLGQLVEAPLYVKYIKKTDEFRVHIFDGQVIDVQRKARLHSVENPNWQVRNLAGGFTYAREGIEDHPFIGVVREAALGAYGLTGLDFGAFDVIVSNTRVPRPYVLEVNTAPGLMGTTLERYVSHIQNRNQ